MCIFYACFFHMICSSWNIFMMFFSAHMFHLSNVWVFSAQMNIATQHFRMFSYMSDSYLITVVIYSSESCVYLWIGMLHNRLLNVFLKECLIMCGSLISQVSLTEFGMQKCVHVWVNDSQRRVSAMKKYRREDRERNTANAIVGNFWF